MDKKCENCIYSNATPVEPPCPTWRECIKNNRCDFVPSGFAKAVEYIRKLFKRWFDTFNNKNILIK